MKIERFDLSKDPSLKAFNASDELLVEKLANIKADESRLALYHDRFGYLACQASKYGPISIAQSKTQENACNQNLKLNQLSPIPFKSLQDKLEDQIDFALLKLPKSQALFQSYLEHIYHNSSADVVVYCGFMTRHFSKGLLEIAGKYFDNTEQSLAKKKARLLMLSGKKENIGEQFESIQEIAFQEQVFKQYKGVFSSKHIDHASAFLIQNFQQLDLSLEADAKVLDIGSGNGVLSASLLKLFPEIELFLLEDDSLAHASGKLNLQGEKVHHLYNNSLEDFEDGSLDLIISNPPFHFEYEVNVQVSLDLFRQSTKKLKKSGSLVIVANKPLNYGIHLKKMFKSVKQEAKTDKYEILLAKAPQ